MKSRAFWACLALPALAGILCGAYCGTEQQPRPPRAGGDRAASAQTVQAPSALSPVVRLPGRITYVVDGDTLDVVLETKIRVRLLDCWSPDGTPNDKKAADYLRTLQGNRVLVEVPLSPDADWRKSLTFGRVLARVYANGTDVGEEIVRRGWATREREN